MFNILLRRYSERLIFITFKNHSQNEIKSGQIPYPYLPVKIFRKSIQLQITVIPFVQPCNSKIFLPWDKSKPRMRSQARCTKAILPFHLDIWFVTIESRISWPWLPYFLQPQECFLILITIINEIRNSKLFLQFSWEFLWSSLKLDKLYQFLVPSPWLSKKISWIILKVPPPLWTSLLSGDLGLWDQQRVRLLYGISPPVCHQSTPQLSYDDQHLELCPQIIQASQKFF